MPQIKTSHWIDASPELSAHLFAVSHRIAKAQEKAFGCERVGIIIAGYDVDVGVRHLVAGDDDADTLAAECPLLCLGDLVADREQVRRQLGGRVDPVIDLLDRHDQRVPGGHRVDRHERHTEVVAPHERSGNVALDDLRENGAHSSGTIRSAP